MFVLLLSEIISAYLLGKYFIPLLFEPMSMGGENFTLFSILINCLGPIFAIIGIAIALQWKNQLKFSQKNKTAIELMKANLTLQSEINENFKYIFILITEVENFLRHIPSPELLENLIPSDFRKIIKRINPGRINNIESHLQLHISNICNSIDRYEEVYGNIFIFDDKSLNSFLNHLLLFKTDLKTKINILLDIFEKPTSDKSEILLLSYIIDTYDLKEYFSSDSFLKIQTDLNKQIEYQKYKLMRFVK